MADDDIDDIDFDDGNDDPDDIAFDDTPATRSNQSNARRELEKRLEMKRLRELLDDTELGDEL